MKVRYFEDTDTLLIEFRDAPVTETRDLDENTVLDFDAKGVDSVVRISPHYYNTREEIEQLSEFMTELSAQIR